MRPPRLEVARAGWGLACLAFPAPLVRVLGGAPADRRAVAVLRVLGVRHLVQAAGSGLAPGTSPGPAVLAVGAWVDGVHSLSGVALALLDRRRARLALTDAAIAAAWGLASRVDARRTPSAAGRGAWTERAARAVLPFLPGAPRW